MSASRPILRVCRRSRRYADEPRLLEDRIDAAHLRQRFNPRPRTELARPADEVSPDPRSAIRRMQHDARQQAQLSIERPQPETIPLPAQPEESIPPGQ